MILAPQSNVRDADAPYWHRLGRAAALVPGLALCGAVTAVAFALEHAEAALFGRAWLEALVLAILVGIAVRSTWTPGGRWLCGIGFAGKTLLEVAVALLGAAISFRTLAAVGPGLVFGIAGVVLVAIVASFTIGRLLGLPHRMAVLVACGNSICGNSAIAAVAPVIGADSDDVAAAIAFTAVLGVVVVLGLPLFVPLLGLSTAQFGVFAGLTVYAVPQVIAATAPVGVAAVHLGTLVKLVRVLMLGPVVLALSLLAVRLPGAAVATARRPQTGPLPLGRMVPWFIVAFLGLATLRTLGAIPATATTPVATVANVLTILSMAALGLGVDVRVVGRAGARVTSAVVASLLLLGAISLVLIFALGFR